MVTQLNTGKIVVVPFWDGYRIFSDLQLLIGGDHATRIMALIVDYCQIDAQAYYHQLQAITKLPTTNPDNVEGVDKMIMDLGSEVFKTFYTNQLFVPMGQYRYNLHQVMVSGKLALLHKHTL